MTRFDYQRGSRENTTLKNQFNTIDHRTGAGDTSGISSIRKMYDHDLSQRTMNDDGEDNQLFSANNR